jgi:DNA replication and repair protein RecF
VHLREIAWEGFRNLEARRLALSPGFNVLEGENAQGKTNVLEAVWWLATLKPLRASRPAELVRFGARSAWVEGRVEREGLSHRLGIRLVEGARQVLREQKAVRPAEYFGVLAVVLFTPDDAGLVRAAPAERRRYLDRAIFTGRPAHLQVSLNHRRALEARNELLRKGSNDAVLEAFEGTLAGYAAQLVEARRRFVDAWAPHVVHAFSEIAGEGVTVRVTYRPSIDDDSIEAHIAALAEDRGRDRERGHTHRGPQADDLGIEVQGRSGRLYASQGQQRAVVLALKIAEIRLLEAAFALTPVLLLDDVSSELDARRNERLFALLHGYRGQVLITTTSAGVLRVPNEARPFRVHAGNVDAN